MELVSIAIVEFTQAEFLGVQDPMGRGVPTPDYLTQVTKNYSMLDYVSTTRLLGMYSRLPCIYSRLQGVYSVTYYRQKLDFLVLWFFFPFFFFFF